jgi:hypothetical protein
MDRQRAAPSNTAETAPRPLEILRSDCDHPLTAHRLGGRPFAPPPGLPGAGRFASRTASTGPGPRGGQFRPFRRRASRRFFRVRGCRARAGRFPRRRPPGSARAPGCRKQHAAGRRSGLPQGAGQLFEVRLIALPFLVARFAAVELAADSFDDVNQNQLGAVEAGQSGRVLERHVVAGTVIQSDGDPPIDGFRDAGRDVTSRGASGRFGRRGHVVSDQLRSHDQPHQQQADGNCRRHDRDLDPNPPRSGR